MLRVGPPQSDQVYSITVEGNSKGILAKYPQVFKGVGKLNDFQMTLYIDRTVRPVAQQMRRLPFALREKVENELKFKELVQQGIFEEI